MRRKVGSRTQDDTQAERATAFLRARATAKEAAAILHNPLITCAPDLPCEGGEAAGTFESVEQHRDAVSLLDATTVLREDKVCWV